MTSDPRGFSLVEVMLTSAIFVLLVTTLVGAYLYGQESTALAGRRAGAAILAEEGLEAVRNIRDHAFANLTDGAYGLSTSGNQWSLSGSQDTNDIFTRQIVISTIDTKRKSITAHVTWQQNPQRYGLVSLATRLTNWITIGSWATPIQESSIDISGTQNGTKVQIAGNYAYVVRNSGTPNFAIIDVSTPSPSLIGSLSLSGTPLNIYVSSNYAYIASSNNTQELQIIDISNPSSPNVVGTYDDAGNENARGIFVSGPNAYLALNGGNDFVIVNVSIPSAPIFISGLTLSGGAYEIVVQGNYAYLSSGNNNQELQVVDITVPTLVGSLNLPGNADAPTLSLAGTTLLIGQENTLYTVNVSTPAIPSLLGFLSIGGTTNDIALNLANGNTYAFIATSHDSLEFQIIDISTPSSPTLLSSVNTAGTDNLNGVAYDTILDRAFSVGGSNSEEFFVFAPQ